MRQAVIAIDNVSALYGRGARQVQALRDVSLTVQPGEIFGLLGPNGAGKTTLLACIEGLHRPVQGSIRVAGLDVGQQPAAVKRKLGLQLQRTALLDDLPVSELLEVYAALYEVYLTPNQKIRRCGEPQKERHRISLGR
jgi:ABC-2 type transport system ATP-binding protein